MYTIVPYTADLQSKWDDLVLHHAVNGTFLQNMRFLSYHPPGRFTDRSLLIYDRYELAAVVPGCSIEEDGAHVFFSHKGTSYGGILIDDRYHTSTRVLEIVETLDTYLAAHFDRAVLRITPDLFCRENTDLLQYGLYYHGFSNYAELSTYVDLVSSPEDVRRGFDRNKNRNIKKCLALGLTFRELTSPEEIDTFHTLLTINLSKFGVSPIHTTEELCSLKYDLVGEHIRFFGVFNDETMVAAGMMFDFGGRVFHAQNLSYDIRIRDYSPITFLYYKVIEYAKLQGYQALSWGISTEQHGKVLNSGLILNKEAYGSRYQVNRTYYKDYTAKEMTS